MDVVHQILCTFLLVICVVFPSNMGVLGKRTFELDQTWPDKSVSDLKFYGSGIVLDGENNLIVLHRSNAMSGPRNETIKEDVVIVIHRTTGEILRSFGKNFFYHPHGIEVTENGDIFVTDSRLYQVFKFEFNPSTKLWDETPILVLGERFVPGNDATHFCTPADVAGLPGVGDFYVADGYCNSRIVKFDKTGKYLLEFTAGSSTVGVPPIPFNITHAVTLATRHSHSPADPSIFAKNDTLVFVADRDNTRIQCFNSVGKFLYELTNTELGIPRTMLFSVAHLDVDIRNSPYNANFTAEFGIIYGVNGFLPFGQPEVLEIGVGELNATIISRFATSPGEMNAELELEAPHDIAVSKDGREVYVVISNETQLILRKFVMKVDYEGGVGMINRFSEIFLCLMTSVSAAVKKIW